ncbi:hypothetical protein FRC10_011253 [Ceratobasidium sp. 414]|nr:hypothetical protein FRC10_011253 [Ceratobasidium sp. 414]
MHPSAMPYWSPPDTHTQPLLYYDPGAYSFVFPAPHSPYQPPFPVPHAEPNEPRFPYSLHPQAPPFVPSGLVKPPPAPIVPPAPRLDPLAHALRRTMPKVRTHRAAPGERRSSPADTMDSSGVSDKFIYVENVPRDAPPEALKAAFECCGPLKGIFIRFQAERGMVVLAFYDTRHAAAALSQIEESPDQFFGGASITARTPSYDDLTQLADVPQLLPNSPIVVESDSRVYITLVGQTTSLGPQMQNLLATYGDIKMFRVVGMHYKVFHVEFFDVRHSAKAVLTLNNRKIHGAVAHLSTDPNANVVPDNKDPRTADDAELVSLLQATELTTATPDNHAYIDTLPLPTPDTTPTTPDRARYGRRASTGSAFPSPIGHSASQSSDNLAEQPSGLAGVPFPTYSDSLDAQEQQPLMQELGRRRSVAHSFDSASASSASLSFRHVYPLSPDNRTVSTAPSTPAGLGRKLSLPPFQGPLPPPTTNQWPSPTVGSEPADELDGFINLRTTAPSATSPSSASAASRSTLGSAHMCLPASARAVLDLLRDPPPERNRVDIARIEAGLDTRTTIMLKNASLFTLSTDQSLTRRQIT